MNKSTELENNILAREVEMLKAEINRLHVRFTVLVTNLNEADERIDSLEKAVASKDRDITHLANGNRKMDAALNALEQGHDHYHGEAQLQQARADRLESILSTMIENVMNQCFRAENLVENAD